MKGKLIVLEGIDGSGKGTQFELLINKLHKLKIKFKSIDIPRYNDNEYGRLVGRYLKGEFGNLEQVSPYLAALTYAGDRMLAAPEIKDWLNTGYLVIANRYVTSSKAYMSAKLKENQYEFIRWLDNLEYSVNKVPREDLVILLNVDAITGHQNVESKDEREHLEGKKRDIHEEQLDYQKKVSQIYLKLSQKEPHWVVIDCTKNGKMLPKDEINQQILDILKKREILN